MNLLFFTQAWPIVYELFQVFWVNVRRDKIIRNLVRKSGQKQSGGRDALKRFILSKTLGGEIKAMENKPICQCPSSHTAYRYNNENFYAHFLWQSIIFGSGQWTVVLVVKNSPANAENIRDMGSVHGFGTSPGGGHGNPLQYSCLEHPIDRGAWWATAHGITKGQTQLKQFSMPPWITVNP